MPNSASNPAVTNDNRVTLNGYAEPRSTVTLYDGDEMVGMAPVDDNGAWRVVSDRLADGLHVLSATCTDIAGNVSPRGSAYYVNVMAASGVLPQMPISAPSEVQLGPESDTGLSGTDYVTSNYLPVYVGQAALGSWVELVIDGGRGRFGAVVDDKGHWQARGAQLEEGKHTVSVIEHNSSGNVSVPSMPIQLTIDTVAPLKPATPAAVPRSDDSSPDGQLITHTSMPVLTGMTEAGARVDLYDWVYNGTRKIGSAVADSSGVWTIESSMLTDGQHRVSVLVTDLAGNTASSDQLTFNVDTNAPGLVTDGGIAGDQMTNLATPLVYGRTQAHASVTLYEGSKVLGTGVADAGGIWRITTTSLSDGEHALFAQARDQQGKALPVSGTLVLTIDTQAPLSAPSTPVMDARDDHGASPGDQITNARAVTIRGHADANNFIEVYVDGVEQRTRTTSSTDGTWGYVLNSLGDGTHRISVGIEDYAGNAGPRSDEIIITIDTKAPDAPAAPTLASSPASTGASGGSVSDSATPHLTGSAEAGATITLYDGGSRIGTAVADSQGRWDITASTMSKGLHSLTVTATDVAGNTSAASAALSLAIGTPLAAPTAPDLASAADKGVSASDDVTSLATPAFTGKAPGGAIVLLFDGATQVGRTVADSGGAWSIASTMLADGPHQLTAVAQDTDGKLSLPSAELLVTIDTKAPDAPATPTLASSPASTGASGGSVSDSATPRLTGSAEAGATITLYDGASRIGTAVADSQGRWDITASTMSKGLHSLTVTATDVAGNTSAASAALSLTIGTPLAAPTAPDLASAADKGVSASDDVTSLATPAFTGKAPGDAIVLLFDGATQVGRTVANSSGAWSITSTRLADGPHQLTAVAQDSAGNLSLPSAELLVTIDTKAVVSAPVLDPATDSGRSQLDGISNIASPHLSGTAESGATVAVYDGSTRIGTVVADENGAWSIVTRTLSDGKHSLSAKATDVAGNTSASSPVLALTIDTKAPLAPIVLDLLAAADSGVSAADNITSITSPIVSGRAEAYSYVELYDGTTLLGTASADGGGNWKIASLPVLAEGVHNLTAKASDAAGNRSTASSALKLTIDTSVTAPSLLDLVTASDRGASTADDVTSLATPKIAGKADPGDTVVLYDGATRIGSAVASSSGQWTITSTRMSDGVHKLVAVASDKAGNVSKASDELAITVDTKAVLQAAAPSLDAQSDSGVSNSDRITNITTPRVHGTTEAGATVTLYDGSKQVGSTTADAGGAWEIVTKPLAATGHWLTVKVTDIAGNLSTPSPVLAFTVDSKAPIAPTGLDLLSAYDSGVSTSDNKTAISTPAISGRAEANSIVSLYEGEKLLGSTTADGGGRWTIVSTVSLGSGVHSLTAKAMDIAGNVSPASAALAVTVDSSATGLRLAGTSAADKFLLNEEAGRISVTGFSVANDRLVLTHDYNGLLLDSAADVLALGHVVGKDLILDLGDGHEVTLVGITSLTDAAVGFV